MELRVEAGADAPHRVSAVGLSEDERVRLEKVGPAGYPAALAVFTGDPEPDKPAIAGSHELDPEGLHFRPRFPFVPGVAYVVRLDLGGSQIVERFEAAAPTGAAPRVTAVLPSADALPENLLRFYVHFSQPMEPKDAHAHVRLEDDDGARVPLAFVEIEHGLWDPRRTRLTVLLHPGRIKRGVAPGEELGPPLRAGRSYRLVVDASMPDAAGRPMGRGFEKRFTVVAPDRAAPSRAGLKLVIPGCDEDSLVVRFPEPLDEALLRRLVWVERTDGCALDGVATVAEGETAWSFRPSRPWEPGPYSLRVHPALEDRAGNRFDRLFDREIGRGAARAGGRNDPALRRSLTTGLICLVTRPRQTRGVASRATGSSSGVRTPSDGSFSVIVGTLLASCSSSAANGGSRGLSSSSSHPDSGNGPARLHPRVLFTLEPVPVRR